MNYKIKFYNVMLDPHTFILSKPNPFAYHHLRKVATFIPGLNDSALTHINCAFVRLLMIPRTALEMC